MTRKGRLQDKQWEMYDGGRLTRQFKSETRAKGTSRAMSKREAMGSCRLETIVEAKDKIFAGEWRLPKAWARVSTSAFFFLFLLSRQSAIFGAS